MWSFVSGISFKPFLLHYLRYDSSGQCKPCQKPSCYANTGLVLSSYLKLYYTGKHMSDSWGLIMYGVWVGTCTRGSFARSLHCKDRPGSKWTKWQSSYPGCYDFVFVQWHSSIASIQKKPHVDWLNLKLYMSLLYDILWPSALTK